MLGRKGYSTVGGKGGQKRLIRLGWGRIPVLLFVLGILSLSVFLPYWILLKAALSKAWALPLTWDNFTLHNLSFTFFEYGDTQLAIYNTFKLGLITATIGTLLATLIAYITNRNLFRGARYLSFFALAPLVIPGIVLAVGLFIAYTRPPLVLYGTIWILFVAFLTKEMPIGFSQAESTFKSIHPELEDASRIIGANRLMSLKDITAPLARSGLIAAWSFIFIGVIRELSAAILLFAPSSKVVSVVIFDLKEEGQVGVIAVLGILLLAVSFAVILGSAMACRAATWWRRGNNHGAGFDPWTDQEIQPRPLRSMLSTWKSATANSSRCSVLPVAARLRRCVCSPAFCSRMRARSGSTTKSFRLQRHLVPPERRNMSMIFQSYAVWPHMTVAQNVAYGLKFKKIAKAEIAQKVTKLLSVVHLAELQDRYPPSCPADNSSGWPWRAR